MKALSHKIRMAITALIASLQGAHAQNQIGDIHGNQGIITQNQKGDNIIIREAAPRIELVPAYQKTSIGGGKYEFVFKVRISKMVARAVIQAQGANVENMRVDQAGPLSTMQHVNIRQGPIQDGTPTIEESFANAFGDYVVTVTTTDDQPPKIATGIL